METLIILVALATIATLRQDANLHGLCGTVRTGAHGSQGVI